MCRIDDGFAVKAFDEKNDPHLRLIQALDENDVKEGIFRNFLIQNTTEFLEIFKIDKLEDELQRTQSFNSDLERLVKIICARLVAPTVYYFDMDFDIERLPPDFKAMRLLKSVAKDYFPSNAYSLYKIIPNSEQIIFDKFLHLLYGKDCLLSEVLFEDDAVLSLTPQKRNQILFNLLHTRIGFSYSDQQPYSHAFELLRQWLIHDAKSGSLANTFHDFSEVFFAYVTKLDDFIAAISEFKEKSDLWEVCGCFDSYCSSVKNETAYKLIQDVFDIFIYQTDLNNASEEGRKNWSKWATKILIKKEREDIEDGYQSNGELNFKGVKGFLSRLSHLHIETLIEYELESLESPSYWEVWWLLGYSGIWKDKFHSHFSDLDIENKLLVFKEYLHHLPRFMDEPTFPTRREWKKKLFLRLLESKEVPQQLIPQWTLVFLSLSRDFNEKELLISYIDKSIGILRSQLSKNENEETHEFLSKLFKELDDSHPDKALRHRLLLMRSSNTAFANEAIHTIDAQKWNKSMINMLFDKQRLEAGNVAGEEILTSFSRAIAEFCLSRIRLSKGEKASGGKYEPNQVVERSALWRQGYLKALSELGFDLNGKVHKTVNFTMKSDPDEDVRAIAKECYRSVRRDSKTKKTIEDMKRGILAAEWWLLISQRKELNLALDQKEAIKTRRRLLRSP